MGIRDILINWLYSEADISSVVWIYPNVSISLKKLQLTGSQLIPDRERRNKHQKVFIKSRLSLAQSDMHRTGPLGTRQVSAWSPDMSSSGSSLNSALVKFSKPQIELGCSIVSPTTSHIFGFKIMPRKSLCVCVFVILLNSSLCQSRNYFVLFNHIS